MSRRHPKSGSGFLRGQISAAESNNCGRQGSILGTLLLKVGPIVKRAEVVCKVMLKEQIEAQAKTKIRGSSCRNQLRRSDHGWCLCRFWGKDHRVRRRGIVFRQGPNTLQIFERAMLTPWADPVAFGLSTPARESVSVIPPAADIGGPPHQSWRAGRRRKGRVHIPWSARQRSPCESSWHEIGPKSINTDLEESVYS